MTTLLSNRLNKAALWVMIAMMIVLGVILVVFSILVRDIAFPKAHPMLFTLETLALSIIPALPLFLMAHFRGVTQKHAWILFGSFAIKLFAVHILFQFSGFYTWSLPSRNNV